MAQGDTHNLGMGYLLWIFGFMGAHRFYYGRPVSGTIWASESCASPVPGGMSTSRSVCRNYLSSYSKSAARYSAPRLLVDATVQLIRSHAAADLQQPLS